MWQFSIREAVKQDIERIVEVVNAAYRPTPGLEGWTHEAALVGGNRTNVEQVAQALRGSKVLVAICGSKLVGCVQIQPEGLEAHIGMLAVLPSFQAVGLGKRLLMEAEQYAQLNLGAEMFVLLVVAERKELIKFYLRRGYEETGYCQEYPINANVGTPLNPEISLTVLRKRSNNSFSADSALTRLAR